MKKIALKIYVLLHLLSLNSVYSQSENLDIVQLFSLVRLNNFEMIKKELKSKYFYDHIGVVDKDTSDREIHKFICTKPNNYNYFKIRYVESFFNKHNEFQPAYFFIEYFINSSVSYDKLIESIKKCNFVLRVNVYKENSPNYPPHHLQKWSNSLSESNCISTKLYSIFIAYIRTYENKESHVELISVER